MTNLILIVIYLTSIVVANLLVGIYGPSVVIFNAFVFIGLDLTARDLMHELWIENIWLKMSVLVSSGSLISYALNSNAQSVAVASFLAFLSAGAIDTLIYQVLRKKSRVIKINGSNMFSSVADSVIFLLVAFGLPFLWRIALWQILAKVAGGFVWSLALKRTRLNAKD